MHEQRKVSNGEEERKNYGEGGGGGERNVLVTANGTQFSLHLKTHQKYKMIKL